MRVAALSTCASFRPKVVLSPCKKRLLHHDCTLSAKSDTRWHSIGCSLRTPAAGNSGHSNNLATYLNTLAESVRDTYTNKLKEFPWTEARSMVAEQLLILGKKALKWPLVLLFGISFLSDVFMAIAGNRELTIPLGLFTGVLLADFLKQSSQEFFQSKVKDESFPKQLLGVGLFFVSVKLLSLYFNVQAKTLLSHIGNGGLMQVLWLARELQQTANVEMQEEQELGTTSLED